MKHSFGSAVHCDNIDAVTTYYTNRQTPSWAIFQKNQFLTKWEGDDMDVGSDVLEKFLEMLSKSAAIYTLCVYTDVPAGGIKNDTPYDGSFNFKLLEKPMGYLPGDAYAQVGGGWRELLGQLREKDNTIRGLEIQNQRLLLQVEDLQTEEPDQVERILNHPIVQELLPIAKDAIGSLFAPKTEARINGPSTEMQATHGGDNTLTELRLLIPDIDKLLFNFLALSKSKPSTFKYFTGVLRSRLSK